MRQFLLMIFVGSVACCVAAEHSYAQNKQESTSEKVTAKGMVASMDANGDEKIGKEESPAELKQYFDGIDTNADGFIDVEEAEVMAEYANKQQSAASPSEMESDSADNSSDEVTAEQLFAVVDKNKDGKISKVESTGELAKNFGYIDTNKDGLVDIKEAQVALDYARQNGNAVTMDQVKGISKPVAKVTKSAENLKPEELVASMDKNGDGKITKAEAPEDLVLFFGNYDTNADGEIDEQESAVLVAYLRNAMPETADAKVEKKAVVKKVTAESIMKQLDLNGDGKITKEEAPSQLKDAFGYVDVNKDGVIDLKEAQSMADYQNQQK